MPEPESKELRSDSVHSSQPESGTTEAAPGTSSDKRGADQKSGAAATRRIAQHPAPDVAGPGGGGAGVGAHADAGEPSLASLLTGSVSGAKAQQALDLSMKGAAKSDVAALTPAQRAAWATSLQAIADSLTHDERVGIKPLFDGTPDSELDTLGSFLGARFTIPKVGADDTKGVPWDAGGLRRAWSVMDALPPAQVEGNPKFMALTRYKVAKGSQAEGYYDEDPTKAAMGYDPKTLDDADHDFSDKDDPMYGTNAFNETVRHEVGHAVDAMIKGSATYCVGNSGGGDWKDHGAGGADLIDELIAGSNSAIGKWPDAHQKKSIIAALTKASKSAKSMDAIDDAVEALALGKEATAQLKADPVVSVLKTNNSNQEPWMKSSSPGVAVAGRIFQESYAGQWSSYALEARARKVSLYQFRAPGEWFAEAYAAYYEPTPDPKNKGAKLAARDGATKSWFDQHVDNLKAAGAKGVPAGKPAPATKPGSKPGAAA